jgi:exopolysaccharide biosynthesis polyprenyl glycosylphosphotransferase
VTLSTGLGVEGQQAWAERRGRAREPRRSWASPEPFVSRPTEHNGDDDALRARPWSRTATTFQRITVVLDLALAVGAMAAMTVLAGPVTLLTAGLALGAGIAFVLTVGALGGYDMRAMGDGPHEFQVVLRSVALVAGMLTAVGYLADIDALRPLVLLGIPLLAALVGGARYAHRHLLHRRRARGQSMMRTLVVGDPATVHGITQDLSAAPYHGYLVIGACLPSMDDAADAPLDVPTLGALADVPQIVTDYAVNVVVVAGNVLGGDALRRLSWALGRTGAELVVAPGLVEVAHPRVTVHPTAGLSLLRLEIEPPRRRLVAKAVLDRVLASVALVLVAPLVLVAAAAVRLTSQGPAFYRQTRAGIDGKVFTIWKLRSMYSDADQRRIDLLEHSDRDGLMFKMHDDPRVTPVGRVLRRFSIDELPQFFNVVRGDMSLVGPRPPLLDEVRGYADAVHRRLHVKPGITGLWQVSGRANLPWEESVRLDLRYVDNWSVTMDIMILWKTFRAVVAGAGAY